MVKRVLKLESTLTLASVSEVREKLRAALASGDPITVDAEALDEIDLAGLQLLCAAHRGAARQGQTLEVLGAGGSACPAIEQAVAALGFGRDAACNGRCLCREVARG